MRKIPYLLAVLLVPVSACDAQPVATTDPQPQVTSGAPASDPPKSAVSPEFEEPTLVATIPHDPRAYTQGLFVRGGRLWESTGEEGSSEIRETDIATGRVLRRVPVPERAFGEGAVDVGDEILSITWKGGVGYRWDVRTLKLKGTFRYPGEGWGLTRMGTGGDVVMSDGTPELRVVDPKTFAEKRRIRVTMQGRPVERLNELEWIDGQIWANVWLEDALVRIDPDTGDVVGVVDMSPISKLQPSTDQNAVANGIAWDEAKRHLYVTGKRWTAVYRIEVPSLSR